MPLVKKSISKKEEPAVVEKPVVVEEPVVEKPVVVEEPVVVESWEDEFVSLKNKVHLHVKELSEKLKDLKSLEQDVKKLQVLIKKEFKSCSRKKSPNPNRKKKEFPPSLISDQLAEYLGLEKGTKINRPTITKLFCSHANKNGLRNEDNKTIFKADKKMKELLGDAEFLVKKSKPELGTGYSIFNLQTHLKKHYIS